MKVLLLSIITFMLLALPAMAQEATAVMNISVNVVSGTTLNEVSPLSIGSKGEVLNQGVVDFITPPNIDTDVTIDANILLSNDSGDEILAETDSTTQRSDSRLRIELETDISKQLANASGHYSGKVNTVVSYF